MHKRDKKTIFESDANVCHKRQIGRNRAGRMIALYTGTGRIQQSVVDKLKFHAL